MRTERGSEGARGEEERKGSCCGELLSIQRRGAGRWRLDLLHLDVSPTASWRGDQRGEGGGEGTRLRVTNEQGLRRRGERRRGAKESGVPSVHTHASH